MTNKMFYFEVTTGPVPLTIDEIWPDGDAPENPTIRDAYLAFTSEGKSTRGTSLWQQAEEWYIHDGATLTINTD